MSLRKNLRTAAALSSLVVFALALWVLDRALGEYRLADVAAAARAVPWPIILIAAIAALSSYIALSGFDVLALRHIGIRLGYGRILLAAFMAQAITHSTGFAALTGTAIRYRMYAPAGISAFGMAQVVVFLGFTFLLGAVGILGIAALVESALLAQVTQLPRRMMIVIGIVSLTILGAYILWTTRRPKPLSFRGWHIAIPGPGMTMVQILLGAVDLGCAALSLYLLLPEGTPSYPVFLGIYVAAVLIGAASHVPGGLGVFEGIVLLLLPDAPAHRLVSALLLYRIVYHLVPLILGAALLGWVELSERAPALGRPLRLAAGWLGGLLPGLAASLSLVCGAILLFSAALPPNPERLAMLAAVVPLWLIEAGHLASGLSGALLVVLSRGLSRRLDAAWRAAVVLLGVGAGAVLLRAFDWEEAALLALVALALAPARPLFYRHAPLLAQRLTPWWLTATVALLAGAGWLLAFAFKGETWSLEILSRYGLAEHSARGGRALTLAILGAGAAVLAFAAYAGRSARQAARRQPGRIAKALAVAPAARARLAELGDKGFQFGPRGGAFLMYGVSGNSWVALGDPIGPEEEWPELLWAFREAADQFGGWPVFHNVSNRALPLCLDLGLSFLRLGDEAVVPLGGFDAGSDGFPELREARRRTVAAGVRTEIVAGAEALMLGPQLSRISQAWLAAHGVEERAFAAGHFDTDWLARFPLVLARRDDRIVGFANIMTAPGGEEAALDLLRAEPAAGRAVVEALLVAALEKAREQGVRRFDLGLAPPSGLHDLPPPPLSRLWPAAYPLAEVGGTPAELRRWLRRFRPEWRPRHLVTPGGLLVPRAIDDLAALLGGRRVERKAAA